MTENRASAGRRFLRPPSTISITRKSHSFNTADRNQVQVIKTEANSTGISHPALPASTNAALVSGQSEWRSRSLNAKHSFTTSGVPVSAMPSKLVKKSSAEVNNVKNSASKLKSSNSPTHLVKVESSSKEPNGKQRLVKIKTGAKESSKGQSATTRGRPEPAGSSRTPRSSANNEKTKDSRLGLRGTKSAPKTSKSSGLLAPRTAVSRSTSNSSRGSTTTTSPDKKEKSKAVTKIAPSSQVPSKSSSSVLGRLRKLGSPSTTIPNNSTNGVTLRHALPVKSPSANSKSFPSGQSNKGTLEKREKRSLVPPSKVGVAGNKGRNAASKPTLNGNPTANVGKPTSGIKSTFQRAFGGAKEEKKGPQAATKKLSAPVTKSTSKSLNASNNISLNKKESEVVLVSNGDGIPKRYSGEDSFYRRDKIDVQNLKSLLVRPYDNARMKKEDPRVPSPITLTDSELNLSDDEEMSRESPLSLDIPDSEEMVDEKIEINATPPEVVKRRNHDNGIRNIQLPSSSDERKPHKTATVAPFRRQIANNASVSGAQNTQRNGTEKTELEKTHSGVIEEKPAHISVNTSASMEVRRQTAKGIADLRQNLEETMCSLRNSQLRNRMSDEFERRISAQLDADIEEIGLPEVPPPLPTPSSTFRATSNISGIHTISHSTRSPKLHAGECLGPSSYTSPRPSKFSSLQRTPSSRTSRSAWKEEKGVDLDNLEVDNDKCNTDDISSVSSEDLSEYIAGISTDDISLSSNNNSPFHYPKNTSTMQSVSTLANPAASTESLEKSSNSTSESNKSSSSSWKKSKKSLKSSDNELKSKKKLEKKNSKESSKKNAKDSGSSIVGSRLATVDRSESPTSNPAVKLAVQDTFSYRSLPRPNKTNLTHDENRNFDPLLTKTQQNGHEGFVRSPALKILLRSKANKSKLAKSGLTDIPNGTLETPENSIAPSSGYMSTSKYGASSTFKKSEKDLEHRLGFYSSLERKNLHNYSMSASQSLPRRFSAKRSGNTTWSAPRSNANSAYSLPVTPDNNIYDEYGSYMDDGMSHMSESVNSFSNLTVPEYNNFSDAMDKSFQDRHKMSDWPLSGLQPGVAASSPNVARAAFCDRSKNYNYRTIASHDLARRRGSSVSLGGALSNNMNTDETSIAMANTFLFSLAQNKVMQQAHMVQEFEKSLSHLTSRLRELSTTAEEKDTELQELRNTIEQLKNGSPKSDSWTGGKLKKKPSCGSLSSMSSQTSISSAGSCEEKEKKKKRHWLRNSFKSAFGKSKSKSNLGSIGGDGDSRSSSPQKSVSGEVISLSSFDEESCDPETVRKLKEELRQKERKLTDIRLEALTSRHQLQHLQDVMNQMKNEMDSLRKENEQLHQLGLSSYSLTSSSTFLHTKLNLVNDNALKSNTEEMKVKIVVEISTISAISNSKSSLEYITINSCPLPKTLNWSQLDQKITKIFIAYCQTVDPTNCMKLTKDSVESYRIGDGIREIGIKTPDLLPCGYLVGDTDTILIQLRGGSEGCVDLLAFELLIDKNLIEKYVDLVLERQRVLIRGPIGTGKSLLANRLAGYVASSINLSEPGTVIHLDAKQKAPSELQDFLHNIAGSANSKSEAPTIIVLDNLQCCKDISRLMEPFSTRNPLKNLYLICVTNEKDTTELSEFSSVVFSNNSPPVQTYLARKLRRSYLEHQITQNQKPDDVLSLVITWLPKCWQHINDFLESHNGSEVTIGPRMFSSCPMDAASARVWFTDLWNFSVVPYVISAIKKSPNRKNSIHWSDPTQWVMETMPWRDNAPNLLHIRAEDVGPSPTESDYSASLVMSQSSGVTSQSSNATSQSSSDPLLNMLMRLQEAANYDSDTNSSHEDGFELSIDKALTELET